MKQSAGLFSPDRRCYLYSGSYLHYPSFFLRGMDNRRGVSPEDDRHSAIVSSHGFEMVVAVLLGINSPSIDNPSIAATQQQYSHPHLN